jgi:phage host-nuclease inhibitor protein Gam
VIVNPKLNVSIEAVEVGTIRLIPEEVKALVEDFDLPTIPTQSEEALARSVGDLYMRALYAVRSDITRLDGEHEQLQKALQDAYGRRVERLSARQNWLLEQLKRVWALLPKPRGKSKSHTLLMGRIGTRGTPDKWTVTDEKLLLEWARQKAPNIIRVREAVDHARLKQLCQTVGELPPGVSFVAGSENFYAATDNTEPGPLTNTIPTPSIRALQSVPHTEETSDA